MNKTKTNPTETKKRWLRHFAAQKRSGLTPTEYCIREQIPPQHFAQAKYRFLKKPVQASTPGGFKKIKLLPETSAPVAPVMVLLRAGSVNFEILETAPAATIAKILLELNRGHS